ncbi:MAG: S41 family peptidase [Candidatus Hydrogenedentes bacterium]|nr:S41 family peptidase [Candidatus Hydrogenedentota bacterium]
MRKKKSKAEFTALLAFLLGVTLVLTNGFSARIFAQSDERELFEQIEPIGDVLSEILKNYVYEPDVDKAVEGALMGIMNSLDKNSSYVPAASLKSMQEDTSGEFEGIGVHIRQNEDGNIVILRPIAGAPAAAAGLRAGDIIAAIDGVSAEGMDPPAAARRIKGPRGQIVHLTIMRPNAETDTKEELEFDVKRGKIPIDSILEARILDGGIGYIRISDFKKHTARDVRNTIRDFKGDGLKSLIIDLRWNPGGLLTASRDLCELFLPKNTLVTYTRGRETGSGRYMEDMRLHTQRRPVIPETMPLLLLVGQSSASSAEIVTGALQFYARAIVLGEKTYGKGSVQTIIPLRRPKGSALRLTTALYYTPAEVTIDGKGILPDVSVPMPLEQQGALLDQMYRSYATDLSLQNKQNHGSVTGNESLEDTVQDLVLERAVEMLREDSVFQNLIDKYHRDPYETQVALSRNEVTAVH